MQSFILPLIFILFSSGTAVTIFKKKFEEVVPLSLMISMLLVFMFAYFDYMLIGYYLSIFIALLFPFLLIYSFIKKKGVEVLKRFFTPSLLIFLAIYLFIFILNRNRGFTVWDEISHWGPMVKEMLRLDRLYSVPESALAVHKDYPPIVPIFEYIWCKLSGGYKEAYVYRALQILSLSLFFPALKNLAWKKTIILPLQMILYTILILSAGMLIPVGEASFYQSIYIDCLLGLIFAYSVALVFYEKNLTTFGIIRLAIAFSVLLLTKQMGLVFYVLLLVIFVLNRILINKNEFQLLLKKGVSKAKLLKLSLIILGLIVIPCLFFFAWGQYVDSNNLIRQFYISNIKPLEFFKILNGVGGQEYQHSSWLNFENTFLTTSFISRPIILTFWQLSLVSIGLWLIISQYGKLIFKRHQIEALNITLLFGSLGYTLAVLLLYIFCFSIPESLGLISFHRYLGVYWFGVFTSMIMIFMYINVNRKIKEEYRSFIILFFVIFFIWIFLFDSEKLNNLRPPKVYNSSTAQYIPDANLINNNTSEKSKIYVVSQRGCFVGYGLTYLVIPRELNQPFQEMSLGVPYCGGDAIRIMTKQELKTKFLNYDFLYLHQIDDYFIQEYSDIFPEDLQLKNKQLFRIIKDNESVVLELLVEG